MALQLTRRHFTIDDYYAMLRAGILSPDDRVELIDGELWKCCRWGRATQGQSAVLPAS
jgi:hypothetical protein